MQGELLEADRVGSILDAFYAVYNYYGHGLSEAVYAGALEHELRDRGHTVVRELMVSIYYHGRFVARQRLDMVVDNRIIVENKATEKLVQANRMQLVGYLKATSFVVGLLLHFGPSPHTERLVDYPKRTAR